MPKSDDKSSQIDTRVELMLLRQETRRMRYAAMLSFDAIIDRINRLLPVVETAEQRRMKKYSKKDWDDYLTS